MYRAIARNKRNTVFIILLFILLLGALGLFANWAYGRPGDYSIAIFVMVGASLYAIVQYFLADRQAVAMAGAVPIQKADNPRLYRIVENLSIATGTPMPKGYIVPDPAPNAFATGRDPEHAVVAGPTGPPELPAEAGAGGGMAPQARD